jgi:hypothetical protein
MGLAGRESSLDATIEGPAQEGATYMNTETIVHPKLHHYGLMTSDLDPMVE